MKAIQKMKRLFFREARAEIIRHRIVMIDKYHLGVYSDDSEAIYRV